MPATRRFVLDLPVEQADRIDAEVASGRYASPDAFVASRLMEEEELSPELGALDWESLAAEAAEQAERVAAGEAQVRPAETVFAEIESRIHARAALRRAR